MPRRVTNIRWQRVLTDRSREGDNNGGFAGVCNLGNGQMGAIFQEDVASAFNGVFFSLAPAKYKHRFYMSDTGGRAWRIASNIPTDGNDGLNFHSPFFKSGMLGFRPGSAFHAQCGQALNSGEIIFNRPGGIYRMRANDGKWERVLNPGANNGGGVNSASAMDFHIFCDFANPTGFGDGRVIMASGEFDSTVVVGPGPIFEFGDVFFFVRSTDYGRSGSFLQFGPKEGEFPVALHDSLFNIDGIITMLYMKDANRWLCGAHMTQRAPRAWWSDRGAKTGTWHEVVLPGNFDPFITEQYCECFANLGNNIVIAGGGAPTGKFPVTDHTYPDGIPFSVYARMHGYRVVPTDFFFSGVVDSEGNPDNGYWHYPLLWRSTDGGRTYENRSLTVANFAARTGITGGQPGAVGDSDGEWRTRCAVSLGDGNCVLGIYHSPNAYATSESPFPFSNDYGETFPYPGEFETEPYTWFVPQQMTVTDEGNVLVGTYVLRPTDAPHFNSGRGELWLGIVEATNYYSVGFMGRPADDTALTQLRPDLETVRG